ncbi:MAG TPA: hypothetical protein VEA99_11030 [Gemmatimonadaceae bacterium]|nr:hypothetical protein [Gemmatimonadaceae bacterium]
MSVQMIVEICTRLSGIGEKRAYKLVQAEERSGFLFTRTISDFGIRTAPGLQKIALLDGDAVVRAGHTPRLLRRWTSVEVAEQLIMSVAAIKNQLVGWPLARDRAALEYIRAWTRYGRWPKSPWVRTALFADFAPRGAWHLTLHKRPERYELLWEKWNAGVDLTPYCDEGKSPHETFHGTPLPVALVGGVFGRRNTAYFKALRQLGTLRVVVYQRFPSARQRRQLERHLQKTMLWDLSPWKSFKIDDYLIVLPNARSAEWSGAWNRIWLTLSAASDVGLLKLHQELAEPSLPPQGIANV